MSRLKTNLEESTDLEHKKKHHKKHHNKKHHGKHHKEQKESHDLVMTATEDKVPKVTAPAPPPAPAPVAKSLLATKSKNQDDFDKFA